MQQRHHHSVSSEPPPGYRNVSTPKEWVPCDDLRSGLHSVSTFLVSIALFSSTKRCRAGLALRGGALLGGEGKVGVEEMEECGEKVEERGQNCRIVLRSPLGPTGKGMI